MSDLTDALARSIAAADELHNKPDAEDIDSVLAPAPADTYQRFNSTWRNASRREPEEGSS